MAGDWIKVEHATPDKPEVAAIAHRLDLDPDLVFAKCLRVWMWADQQTDTGEVAGVGIQWIDRIAGLPGFGDAMASVRWLSVSDSGIAFPNFDRHNSKSAKNRALTRERVRRSRAKSGNAASVTTSSLLSSSLSSTLQSPSVSDPPKETKKGKSPAATRKPAPEARFEDLDIPLVLDTPRCRGRIKAWLRYRKEDKNKPLTPLMARMLIKRMVEFGHDRAVAAVEHSIANGYQGLFEPPAGKVNPYDEDGCLKPEYLEGGAKHCG